MSVQSSRPTLQALGSSFNREYQLNSSVPSVPSIGSLVDVSVAYTQAENYMNDIQDWVYFNLTLLPSKRNSKLRSFFLSKYVIEEFFEGFEKEVSNIASEVAAEMDLPLEDDLVLRLNREKRRIENRKFQIKEPASLSSYEPVKSPNDPFYYRLPFYGAGSLEQSFAKISDSPFFDSLSYSKINLSNKGLKELSFLTQVHEGIKQMDLSKNKLIDISIIDHFTELVTLDASFNLIPDTKKLSQIEFPLLKKLDISNNRIRNVSDLNLHALTDLIAKNNRIQTFQFVYLRQLKILELRNNKLTSLSFIENLPNLKEIYLAENKITEIDGLNEHSTLEIVHLRKNEITKIPKLNLPSLSKLNLRENKIESFDNLVISLKEKLIPKLNSLSILANEGLDSNPDLPQQLITEKLCNVVNKRTIADFTS